MNKINPTIMNTITEEDYLIAKLKGELKPTEFRPWKGANWEKIHWGNKLISRRLEEKKDILEVRGEESFSEYCIRINKIRKYGN